MDIRKNKNKGLEADLKNGIDGKPLPLAATEEFTRAERVQAAIMHGYEVLPDDVQYHYDLGVAYGVIFNPVYLHEEKHMTNIVRRLKYHFGKTYNVYELIRDVEYVYGEFYQVAKSTRRQMLLNELDALLLKARKQGSLDLELSVLQEKRKLFALDKFDEGDEVSVVELPEAELSSDVEVLEENIAHD